MATPLERYLEGLDGDRAGKAPMIVELDRIVRAHGRALVPDVRYRILLYALNGDYRNWVCAVDATKKVACLRFLYGAKLTDPLQRLRPGTGPLSTLDFTAPAEIDEEAIAPYVVEAVARYAEAVVWLKEQDAERRKQRAATASKPGL
jgi:hypothetical protein